MDELKLTPFVKWVGGKRQMLDVLNLFIPKKINTYFEPFLGGGAVFLNIKPKKALISDANDELITAWNVIKSNYLELKSLLDKYTKKHNKNANEFYYKVRSQDPNNLNDLEKAARFIYLNKTCFNGIYRVNRRNEFNTPFNKKEIIDSRFLFNIDNINNISNYLNENNIKIENSDFEKLINSAQKGDFIFLDPPYDYDNKGFDAYTANGFGEEGQKRLCNTLIELDKKGVKWILTNHNTDLINNLYKKYNIYKIPVNRFINSNSENRKNAAIESIVTNCVLSDKNKEMFDLQVLYRYFGKPAEIRRKYDIWVRNKLEPRRKIYLAPNCYNISGSNLNKLGDSENMFSRDVAFFDELNFKRRADLNFNENKSFEWIISPDLFLKDINFNENLFLSEKYKNIREDICFLLNSYINNEIITSEIIMGYFSTY